jgi:hypothetical protein
VSVSAPLEPSPTETLKLTFQIVDEHRKVALRPHQTIPRSYYDVSGEEVNQPIHITPGQF